MRIKMKSQPITLGGIEFKSKAQAKRKIKDILARGFFAQDHKTGQSEEEMIRDLIELHPNRRKKIGSGIKIIRIVPCDVNSANNRFEIERTDGTKTDFSYKKCLGEATNGVGMKYSYIYFITDETEKYVKIGRTIDTDVRLASLQTASPYNLRIVKVLNETRKLKEKHIHAKFAKYRKRGEWFEFSEEIKNYIS